MPEGKAYVKKLYSQELGYRRGEPGMAGRYFFVSKKYTGYFPPLSEIIKNDFAIIKVIPPDADKIVLTKFVYHNSKISENKPGGRDEYRIYMNSDIDPNGDYYKESDIVVIYKNVANENEILYKIYHFAALEMSDQYIRLGELLQKYSDGSGGSHALVPVSELPFIRPQYLRIPEEKVIPQLVVEEALKTPFELIPEDQMKKEFEFTRFTREGSFRDLVLYFYEYKCAVTETFINYKDLYNLEAAHIIPDSHRGPAHPRNGIALSRDMHWSFDKGFFTINDDFAIVVHDKVRSVPVLSMLNGKKIFLPSDQRAWPSTLSLKYHRENIFGIFMSSVEIRENES